MDVSIEEVQDTIINIFIGCKEKKRRKKIFDALRKLKEDEIKYNYVKKVV